MEPLRVDNDEVHELVRKPGIARQLEEAGGKLKHCEIQLTADFGDEARISVNENTASYSGIQFWSLVEIVLWYPERYMVEHPNVNDEFREIVERMGYEVWNEPFPIAGSHGVRLRRKTTGSAEAVIDEAIQHLPALKAALKQLIKCFDDEAARARNATS